MSVNSLELTFSETPEEEPSGSSFFRKRLLPGTEIFFVDTELLEAVEATKSSHTQSRLVYPRGFLKGVLTPYSQVISHVNGENKSREKVSIPAEPIELDIAV